MMPPTLRFVLGIDYLSQFVVCLLLCGFHVLSYFVFCSLTSFSNLNLSTEAEIVPQISFMNKKSFQEICREA
jgi:hypothetical protein